MVSDKHMQGIQKTEETTHFLHPLQERVACQSPGHGRNPYSAENSRSSTTLPVALTEHGHPGKGIVGFPISGEDSVETQGRKKRERLAPHRPWSDRRERMAVKRRQHQVSRLSSVTTESYFGLPVAGKKELVQPKTCGTGTTQS